MANPFDQFDSSAKPASKPVEKTGGGENPFDKFDKDKPAIFYPSAEKTKAQIEIGPYKGEETPPKEPSVGEVASAAGFGSAINLVAPRAMRNIGRAIEPMPGAIGRVGKGLDIAGRVYENVPATSRAVTGAVQGGATNIAGQLGEYYLGIQGPARFMFEMGIGSVPALSTAVERYVFNALARRGGGIDMVHATQLAAKEISNMGDKEKKVLDSMSKALGGEKYEQGSMEYIYMLVGREGLNEMTAAKNEADAIIANGKYQADQVRNTNIAEASRILNEANRQAAEIMQTANNRLKNNIARKLDVSKATEQKLNEAKSNIQTMIGETKPLFQIGNDIRTDVLKTQKGLEDARKAQRDVDIAARTKEVQEKVNSGNLISGTREYQGVLNDLQRMLLRNINTIPREAPVTAKAQIDQLNGLLNSLEGKSIVVGKKEIKIPPSFEAVDQIRRSLGEAFKGKPPEGYESINRDFAKDMYVKLSKIMGKYSPAHKEFISNYEEAARELDIFKTKAGKKAVALDGWIDNNFSADSSGLASYYFKTAQRVSDLLDLTKNQPLVEKAASDYVANLLVNKDSTYIKNWLNDKVNRDWLTPLPNVRKKIEAYADQLAAAEAYAQKGTSIVKKIEGAETRLPREAGAEGKKLLRQAKLDVNALTGEKQAAELERMAAAEAKPLQDKVKAIEALITQNKSPVDEFANYVIAANAPGNIQKISRYVVDGAGEDEFKKGVISTMARISPKNLKDAYQTRIRYALEGSRLYTPQELLELDRRVESARDPRFLEQLLKGWVLSVGASEIPNQTRNVFNKLNLYPVR